MKTPLEWLLVLAALSLLDWGVAAQPRPSEHHLVPDRKAVKKSPFRGCRNFGKTIAVFGGSLSVNKESDAAKRLWADLLDAEVTTYGVGGAGFAIEGKEGITRISYERIVCFESVAKRISVRLAREQYSYYDTLDHLQESLPPQFVRCHRSYIVNLNRATKLVLSDNTIHMDDGSQIPVSRSYKARVKELMG